MAGLRNHVISVLRLAGHTDIAAALRHLVCHAKVSGTGPTGVDRVDETVWANRGSPSLFAAAPVTLDLLDIESVLFLGTLVTLGPLGPEPGNRFCFSEVIKLRGPVHIAAPVTVDGLIGRFQIVVVVLVEGLKDDVYSPAYVRPELNREAVVSEPVLRPVIHDSHGFLLPARVTFAVV
jgi:hypothetical protein